jgi:hypothetical protein
MSSQAGQGQEQAKKDEAADAGVQIDPTVYTAVGRALYFADDVDAYLQDLGIDTTDLQDDNNPDPGNV